MKLSPNKSPTQFVLSGRRVVHLQFEFTHELVAADVTNAKAANNFDNNSHRSSPSLTKDLLMR